MTWCTIDSYNSSSRSRRDRLLAAPPLIKIIAAIGATIQTNLPISWTKIFWVSGAKWLEAEGGRNDLAPDNNFDLVVRKVTGQKSKALGWTEPPDYLPTASSQGEPPLPNKEGEGTKVHRITKASVAGAGQKGAGGNKSKKNSGGGQKMVAKSP